MLQHPSWLYKVSVWYHPMLLNYWCGMPCFIRHHLHTTRLFNGYHKEGHTLVSSHANIIHVWLVSYATFTVPIGSLLILLCVCVCVCVCVWEREREREEVLLSSLLLIYYLIYRHGPSYSTLDIVWSESLTSRQGTSNHQTWHQ